MATDHSHVANVVARIGFCSTMVFGSIQIFLTYFVSQSVFGTYKLLITLFAAFGMVFSVVEVLVYPNVQILNYGALFFTTSRPFDLSLTTSKLLLVSYCWFYAFTISFLAVMFIYRYWAVFNQQHMNFFRGAKISIWLIYCSYFGLQYSAGIYFCLYFDQVSFDYFKDDVFLRYNVSLDEIPAMAMVAFDPENGEMRWRNVSCIINIFMILGVQYGVMIWCGLKMHWEMDQKIKYFSPNLRKHHQQFFKTLVIQISAPTLTLFAPLVFIICLPLFNIEVDMSVGVLICSFTMYPAIDAFIIMYVVSDYRKIVLELWISCCEKIGKIMKPSSSVADSLTPSSKRTEPASITTQVTTT